MSLTPGTKVICKLNETGEEITVELEDEFEPDTTVGIFGEPGWFCFVSEQNQAGLFLSREGILYAPDDPREESPRNYSRPIGVCPSWQANQISHDDWNVF